MIMNVLTDRRDAKDYGINVSLKLQYEYLYDS